MEQHELKKQGQINKKYREIKQVIREYLVWRGDPKEITRSDYIEAIDGFLYEIECIIKGDKDDLD